MPAGSDSVVKGACRSLFCSLLKWPLGNHGNYQKVDGYRVRRVLVMRHDGVRHMVASLPSFRLIKRLAPQCRLDVLASRNNLALAEACPDVDSAIEFPSGWLGRMGVISSLRKQNYDLILNLMFTGTSENGTVANLIGGKQAVKVAHYRKLAHSVFYNVQALSTNRGHSIWEKLPMMVADAFNGYADLTDLDPTLVTDPRHSEAALRTLQLLGMAEEPFVALHCFTREAVCQWAEGAYAELIPLIRMHLGFKVLLLCDRQGEAMAGRLKSRFPGVEVYPSGVPVLEQAALLAKAQVVVTPDITLLQLCHAVGTRVVNLCPWMGKAQDLWRPVGPVPWRQIVAPPGCGVQVIQVDRVWEAVSELAVRY